MTGKAKAQRIDPNRIVDMFHEGMIPREIANSLGTHRRSVYRVLRASGIQTAGKGVIHHWRFTAMTPELAYLLGAFVTDGHLVCKYKTDRINAVVWSITSKEFADRIESCLKTCGLPVHRRIISVQGRMRLVQHRVSSWSSLFSRWLDDVTNGKSRSPQLLENVSGENALAYIEGVIDGDGSIKKDGSIRVRATGGWIHGLPAVCAAIGIRTSISTEVTPSGKPYHVVNIRRSDFRDLTPCLAVPKKHDRMMDGKEERTERRPKRHVYPCPKCGGVMKNKHAKQCRSCYQSSPDFLERIRSQAKKAGKRANEVRWGH